VWFQDRKLAEQRFTLVQPPSSFSDGKTETFPDCAEANKFIKRESYRKPWIVPDQV